MCEAPFYFHISRIFRLRDVEFPLSDVQSTLEYCKSFKKIIVTVYVKGRFRLNRVLLHVISLHNLLAIFNQSKNCMSI